MMGLLTCTSEGDRIDDCQAPEFVVDMVELGEVDMVQGGEMH